MIFQLESQFFFFFDFYSQTLNFFRFCGNSLTCPIFSRQLKVDQVKKTSAFYNIKLTLNNIVVKFGSGFGFV